MGQIVRPLYRKVVHQKIQERHNDKKTEQNKEKEVKYTF